MEWSDDGIILGARAHGENHAVAEIFTPGHGRWAGLVYGGQGRRMQPVLQSGNGVKADWKGRLADSLGHFSLELTAPRAAAAMQDRLALAGLSAACAVASACLPEREAHPRAWHAMAVLLDAFDSPDVWPALMARWELGLLAEVGFGLTLDRCAASGARENLVYVSPRSASAVSAEAGEPYKDKLLRLPAFLRDGAAEATAADALDALTLTGYFIETRILHLSDKQLPEARRNVAALLAQQAACENQTSSERPIVT
ncbi:MAG: DNA repair protein RecO [Parvularculaceae bacterium]